MAATCSELQTDSDSSAVPPAAVPRSLREGRKLIEATRPFALEDGAKSAILLATTIALLAMTTAIAATAPSAWVRLPFAIVSGLTIVRMFILYHDYMHGALLRSSKLARGVLYVYAT